SSSEISKDESCRAQWEDESCRSGKVHLPFAPAEPGKVLQKRSKRRIAFMSSAISQKWSKKSEGSHRQALKTIHLVTAPASSASPLLRHLRPDRERKKQQARAVLLERYEAVQRFVKQGLSHREIS